MQICNLDRDAECAAGPGDAGFRDGVRPYREIPPNPRPNSNWLKIS